MTLAKMAGLSVFLHPLCSGRRSATRIISLIVVVNGTLCHGASELQMATRAFRVVDIAVNMGLVTYVNVVSEWKWTWISTLVTIACWTVNNVWFQKSAVLHFFGLQLMMCVALTKFDVTDP
tara:strand:- start:323 stop:685 length:363 start_codon:yes stop_codon:yes gene_type:complete